MAANARRRTRDAASRVKCSSQQQNYYPQNNHDKRTVQAPSIAKIMGGWVFFPGTPFETRGKFRRAHAESGYRLLPCIIAADRCAAAIIQEGIKADQRDRECAERESERSKHIPTLPHDKPFRKREWLEHHAAKLRARADVLSEAASVGPWTRYGSLMLDQAASLRAAAAIWEKRQPLAGALP